MQYAIVNNQRVLAFPYGRGVCSDCGSETIAKTGTEYIWHWAHKSKSDCDSWHEPMSQWHIDWQDKFPKDWQEVTVKENDIIHRADVKTPKGIVIEFQNSPISRGEIAAREIFYNKMFWVINAQKFSHKLKIASCVKSNLRAIEKEIEEEVLEYSEILDEEIKEFQKELKEK